MTNETDAPMIFDGRAVTIQVANLTEPIKLLDCLRPIPPGATVPIDVVIQGDIDGGRSDLSINNEMRIMLPTKERSGALRMAATYPAMISKCRSQCRRGQFRSLKPEIQREIRSHEESN